MNKIENWEGFVSLAYSHGIFPLVYRTLKEYAHLIPEYIFAHMKQNYMDIVKQNMLMTSELIKVIKILEENGIEAISFKGPVLSQMAYGDVVSRQYCDLDVLVQKEEIFKIENLLKNKYKRALKLTSSQEDIWIKYAHDLSLTNQNGINIEFHWSMFDSNHPINLVKINFFKHSIKTIINNQNINTISNEKFLVYLCIHGSKHLYERIEWVCDIDRFIKTQKVDWDIVEDIIKNDNSKKFFLLGLFLTKILFNTDLGKNYENQFDNEYESVKSYIFDTWNGKQKSENKNNMKYMLKLFVSKTDKLKYLNKIYFKPTFTEYWYINLPKSLYFLYYPLRQYLLLKKYFFDK